MAKYTLVIDQGGHSTRAVVFNKKGVPLAYSSEPIDEPVVNTEHRVEYAVDNIITATQLLLKRLLPQLSPKARMKLDSAALIAQRSSIVACDKTGNAISHMLSWQGTRNSTWLTQQKIDIKRYQQLTGLRLNPHMGASKIRWLLDNDKRIQRHAANNDLCFMPWGAFFLQKITQAEQKPIQLICDPILAARTGLTEYGEQHWSQMLLDMYGIPKQVLPQIVPSTYPYGTLTLNEHTIPIQLSGGDQNFIPCAYGVKKMQKNIFVNMGTGVFIQALGKTKKNIPILKTAIALEKKNTRANNTLEGTVNAAANLLEWWLAQLERPFSQGEIDQLLDETINAPVLTNTLTGTGSPYWLTPQTPTFLNDGETYNDKEKTVAVIESILFACKVNIDLLRQHNAALTKIIISGGLARSDGLCQKLANLTDISVSRYEDTEASARGAAFYLQKKKKYKPDSKPTLFKPDSHNLTTPKLKARFALYKKAMQELSTESGT